MIGDLLAWLFNWFNQSTCAHDYEPRRTPYGAFTFQECQDCGRTKDFIPL